MSVYYSWHWVWGNVILFPNTETINYLALLYYDESHIQGFIFHVIRLRQFSRECVPARSTIRYALDTLHFHNKWHLLNPFSRSASVYFARRPHTIFRFRPETAPRSLIYCALSKHYQCLSYVKQTNSSLLTPKCAYFI